VVVGSQVVEVGSQVVDVGSKVVVYTAEGLCVEVLMGITIELAEGTPPPPTVATGFGRGALDGTEVGS
jgi:hypothetical protein